MSDWRDPAIKLFGRKIPLQEQQTRNQESGVADPAPAIDPTLEEEKDACIRKSNNDVEPKKTHSSSVPNNSTDVSNETSTEITKAADKPQPEQDHKESCISGEDKLLKKPDKVLPCPRCNSMETKFCYYNNYNVNQPRHFCKNCQRYWTAGGSMRNVPVGAGRRKNKHNPSTYRHTAITPDALASIQADGPDSLDHKSLSPFNGNATLLRFGPDAPLCESISSMHNLGDQNLKSQLDFTAENIEETSCSSACKPEENGFPDDDDNNNNNNNNNNNMQQNSMHSSPLPHMQYFPGPLWGYPWNPGWNNAQIVATQENDIVAHMSSCNHPSLLPSAAFCPPYPFPFLPPFWGWNGGQPWNIPWSGNNEVASPSSCTSTSYCSGNNSPTLGKHSREEKSEKSLWIPKTLRINDPNEAAKSSIFATLGIKPVEACKFKAFSLKTGNVKEEASNATQVLHANPAAMSRSQSFQEITS